MFNGGLCAVYLGNKINTTVDIKLQFYTDVSYTSSESIVDKYVYNKQYYAVEDGEYFKDLIVRIDADANEGNIVNLIRIKGSIKPADVPLMIKVEESTTVDVKKQEE